MAQTKNKMIALFESTYDRIYMLWVESEKQTPTFLDVTDYSFSFTDTREIDINGGTDTEWGEVEITVTAEMVLNQRLENNACEKDIEIMNLFSLIRSVPKTLDEKVSLRKLTFELEDLQSIFEGEQDTIIQFLLDYSKCVFSELQINTHYL